MDSQEQLSLTTYASRSSSISGYRSVDMERRPSHNSTTRSPTDSANSERLKLQPQPSRWLTIAPMVAAILPAAITLAIDEAAGSLLADVIFLITIGYAVWGLSNAAWNVLVHCISIDKDRTPMLVADPLKGGFDSTAIRKPSKTKRSASAISSQFKEPDLTEPIESKPVKPLSFTSIFALLIYLATPLVGGGALYLARNNFDTGSMLITNFNILLYTSLESVRTIHQAFHILVAGPSHGHRFAGRGPPGNGGEYAEMGTAEQIAMERAIQELQAKMMEQMEVARHAEIQIDSLTQELVSVSRRIFENEATVQSSIMTIYKEFEAISLDIKELSVIVKKLRRSVSGGDPTAVPAKLRARMSFNDMQNQARKGPNLVQSHAIGTQQNIQQARQDQSATLSSANERTSNASNTSKADKAPMPSSMPEMKMSRNSIGKHYFTSIICWPVTALKGIFLAFYKIIRWIIQ